MKPENNGDLVLRLVSLYRYNDRLHHRVLDASVPKEDLSSGQHRMIGYLYHHNEVTSQSEIASGMRISTAAVAVCLKKLEDGGYVTRSTEQNDRRYNRISLTDKGLKTAQDTGKIFSEVDRGMFDGIKGEELEMFAACLEKINSNLHHMMDSFLEENSSEKIS